MRSTRRRRLLYVSLALALMLSFLIAQESFAPKPNKTPSVDVLVGVDATFSSVQDMKTIIDEAKDYTNFFVVGSTAITYNLTSLNEVCQYLNDSGLAFLTYTHPSPDSNFSKAQAEWISEAKQKWNSTFLGLYGYDEPGGHQIDHDDFFMTVQQAANYSDAAENYVKNLTGFLNLITVGLQTGDFPIFTSDYALHEFDYRAGYSTVFTEFGWDINSQLSVALGRGAAIVHSKDWGVMITRSNVTEAQSGKKMLDDMILAYKNGAKYIVVFDYPSLADGILGPEHFEALNQFWQYAQSHPRTNAPAESRIAYVAPKDYGYGFRGPADKIWGLWEKDNQSTNIWNSATDLLKQYGLKLDIIYEDSLQRDVSAYSKLIFWNGTIIAES